MEMKAARIFKKVFLSVVAISTVGATLLCSETQTVQATGSENIKIENYR